MKKRKILSLILSLVMILTALPLTAVNSFAQEGKLNTIVIDDLELNLEKTNGLPDFDEIININILKKMNEESKYLVLAIQEMSIGWFVCWTEDGINFNNICQQESINVKNFPAKTADKIYLDFYSLAGYDNGNYYFKISKYYDNANDDWYYNVGGYAVTSDFETFTYSETTIIDGDEIKLPAIEGFYTYYEDKFGDTFVCTVGDGPDTIEVYASTDGKNWEQVVIPEMKVYDLISNECDYNIKGDFISYRFSKAGNGCVIYKTTGTCMYLPWFSWSALPDFYYTEDFKTFKKVDVSALGTPIVNKDTFDRFYIDTLETQTDNNTVFELVQVKDKQLSEEEFEIIEIAASHYVLNVDTVAFEKVDFSHSFEKWYYTCLNTDYYWFIGTDLYSNSELLVYSNSNTINYEINGSNIGNYWFNFDYSEESGEYIYKYLRGITSDGKNIFYSTDLLNTDNSAKTIYYFPINEVSDESTYSIVAFVNNIAVIEKSTCIEETDEDYGTYTWYDREYYYLDCTELFDYVENELVVEPTPDDPTPTPEVPADVSGDGKLSVVDAKWILQAVANARTLTDEQRSIADVNGDGKVTIVDAKWILQAVAGMRVL